MYYYIYDNYLSAKKYQTPLVKIESRLTDLGINGKIVRMSALKNISNLLSEDIKGGIKNIIVVGNNQTLNQVINLIDDFSLTLGFIPLGPDNNLAQILGIPEGEAACDVLSSRIIQQLPLGVINDNYYFLSYLELSGDGANINCDDNYFINVDNKKDKIIISNIYWGEDEDKIFSKNSHNFLNLIVKNTTSGLFKAKKDNFSFFQAKKITISSTKSIPLLLIDEKRIIKTPLKISISKEKINLVVGKKRKLIY